MSSSQASLGSSGKRRVLLQKFLKQQGFDPASDEAVISKRTEGPFPLSFGQERLWILDRLEPASSAYNICLPIALEGDLEMAALQHAINEILRRHDVLRARFSLNDAVPVQEIAPASQFSLPVVDIERILPADRDQECLRLIREDADRPFDLEAGPLFRLKLLKLDPRHHVLCVVMHHTVSDDWSLGLFLRELSEFYNAFRAGQFVPSNPPQIQYTDFAHWQREWLSGERLEEQLAYWKHNLAGASGVLELPADRPRPRVQTYNGAALPLALPRDLSSLLEAFARSESVTPFMVLLAAFNVLLYRYTGQEEILVGTPIANRNHIEIENLIGFFVNTLVLRTSCSGELTFRQLLGRVRETALGAFAHQDLPFEKLVEGLNPERSLAHSPIFQVMFVFHNAPAPAMDFDGLKATLPELERKTSKFDLSLYMHEGSNGFEGLLEYNTDLFDASTMERWGRQYQTLLAAVVANPSETVAKLPVLTEDERTELAVKWNRTDAEFPQKTLSQWFEEQHPESPTACAVTFEGSQLSYGELNRRSNQLARRLREAGVGRGVLVGVCLERSLEMLVALLGVLKAGGAYVPLDPSFPSERLAYMVEDSGMPVLITHRQLERHFSISGVPVVDLDNEREAIARHDAENLNLSDLNPDDAAYVLYTSGSTGKPKGVEITHAALVNFLRSMQREPGFSADDRLLAVTTLSFDIAGLELYLPLVSGGTVVIASREEAYDPARLMTLLRDSRCTVMQATPATWRALVDAGWEGSAGLKILCGGEALQQDLAEKLLDRCGELWNVYGPTETTIWSTAHRVTSAGGSIPIGKPIANTQIYLLDRNCELVPEGAIGELYIAGAGLARGYLNRLELTGKRFVPNPFTPGSRMYRTGDLARWLPGGVLECLGRVDDQVKIRGFRIELGEVESVLSSHPAVHQCAVIARADSGDKVLAAYFEPLPGAQPSVRELRAHLKQQLPEYMVPSVFVGMEKLPLTPNGKIDRKALLAIASEQDDPREFVAPRDTLELGLAQLWSRVLKHKRVGIHDNFFELGGHSLLAVRLVVEIEKRYGRRLPLAILLEAPTVVEIAELMRKDDWKPSWSSLVPIRAGGAKPPLFLMHSHGGNVLEYFPLAEHLNPELPVYALQARGLDGEIAKDPSMKEMARFYVNELKSFQPEGPYFLAGFCFGGLLALEAAQQLSDSGEEVALLVLIQTSHPFSSPFRRGTPLLERCWGRAAKRIDLERENLLGRRKSYFRERTRHAWDVVWARAEMMSDRLRGDSNGGNANARRRSVEYILESLSIEHAKALAKYEPRPYQGDVLLVRASKQLPGLATDPYLGWRDILRGHVEVIEIAGHQQNILTEPKVAAVAREIDARLQVIQQRGVLA